MAPKPASRAAKPASKAAPVSKAKATPTSKAAPTSKPAASEKPASTRATKPVPTRPASSRRGAASAAASPAPKAKESAPVANGMSKSKANGHAAKVDPEEEQKTLTAAGKAAAPAAKKGRVAQLAADEPAAKRRKSSIGVGMAQINAIPQPPPRSDPHRALFVFGTGDMGQFGLGPDELEEIGRPKIHEWLENEIANTESDFTGLESVACGGMHTLAIDEQGQVRSWGINDNAALGRQTANVPDKDKPGEIKPSEELETYPYVVDSLVTAGFRAVQVDAGDSISVALSDMGELRAWGSFRSNDGILGFDGNPGSSQFQWTPMAIPALQKEKLVSVSCGADHVLALTTTGRVWVWGNGQQNQLGRRIIERRKINGLAPERLGLRNIVLASTGTYHSFAVNTDGKVFAWGLNTFHQTGVAPEDGGNEDMIIVPTEVTSLRPSEHDGARVIQIEGGEHHTIFLFDNGEVWGCGRADANQMGIAEDHPAQAGLKERREEIKAEKQDKVEKAQKRLDAAKEAQKDSDDIEEAERELLGVQASLAAAMDEYVPDPVRIYFPPIPESYEVVPEYPSYEELQTVENPIAHISSGPRHILAVSKSGHVYAWGLGMGAQLGLGQEESAEVPTLVRSKSLRPYTAIYASAGGQHCVLLGKKGDPHAKSA